MDYTDPALVTEAHRALDHFRERSGAAFLRVDPNALRGDPAEAAHRRGWHAPGGELPPGGAVLGH